MGTDKGTTKGRSLTLVGSLEGTGGSFLVMTGTVFPGMRVSTLLGYV